MADLTKQSPSLSKMLGGPTNAIGGGKKVSGFQRPSGNQNAAADKRVAPSTTVAGR